MSTFCYKCQKELIIDSKFNIPRTEECPNCYANVRSCKMCNHYDTFAYNDCKEPVAERILDKEKANFCDHYRLKTDDNSQSNTLDDIKSAADALFKK